MSVPIHNDFDVDINVYVEPHSNQFLGSSSVTPVNVPYTVYRDLFVLSKAGTPLAEFASRLPSDSTGLFKTPVGTIASSMVELSPVLHKALGFFQLNSANPSIDLVLNRDMINQVGTSPDRYSLSIPFVANAQDPPGLVDVNARNWDLEMLVTREIGKAIGFSSNASHGGAAVVTPTALDLMIFSEDTPG